MHPVRALILLPLGLYLLASTGPVRAADDDAAAFREAYAQYLALAAEDPADAAPFAELAMQLGEKVYGRDSENAALLTFNYGKLLMEIGDRSARATLKRALARYENVYGDDALELVDPLIQLGHTGVQTGRRANLSEYNRAIALAAEKADSPELVGDLNFDAGSRLIAVGQSPQGQKFLETAIEIYTAELGVSARKTGLASFFLGRYHASRGEQTRAAALFSNVPSAYDEGSDIWRSAHEHLIVAHHESGDPKQATPSVLALARVDRWDGHDPPIPLYRSVLRYPSREQRSGIEGEAIIEFNLDQDGFVRSPRVVSTSGSESFGRAAMDVFDSWRFMPRIENDSPVSTAAVRYRVEFYLQ